MNFTPMYNSMRSSNASITRANVNLSYEKSGVLRSFEFFNPFDLDSFEVNLRSFEKYCCKNIRVGHAKRIDFIYSTQTDGSRAKFFL